MRAIAERSERDLKAYVERSEREMAEFKAEMRQSKVDLNRRLGGIANSQGRLVEDIVCPGSALRGFFQLERKELLSYTIRVQRPHPGTGLQKEFDLVAAWHTGWLICEAKSRLRPEALLASFAIRSSFVEMFFELDVSGIFPSHGSILRCHPLLHWVPWARFPCYRFTSRMRLS